MSKKLFAFLVSKEVGKESNQEWVGSQEALAYPYCTGNQNYGNSACQIFNDCCYEGGVGGYFLCDDFPYSGCAASPPGSPD